MSESAVDDMLEQGQLEELAGDSLDRFVARTGLSVLFFPGDHGHRRQAHDVAVALREFLKAYGTSVSAAVVRGDEARERRFRVQRLPSLVFVVGGEALEVLPSVNDWAVYSSAFQRYLGAPPPQQSGSPWSTKGAS